jgi:hypothetical protein
MPGPGEPGGSSLSPVLETYLDALAASLVLPAGERREVRDEIADHLADVRSELVEAGHGDEAADAEAIRRLGAPETLGRDITQARQTRRALLAAVGGATWAAAGAGLRGLVLGVAAVTVVAMAGMLGMAVASRVAGDGTWTLWDAGWFTAIGVTALWVSVALAGRAFVSVASRRSHRPAAQIRPWVAAIGGVLVAWLALAWLAAPQNLFSVISLVLVPVAFGAAAMTASDRPLERTRRARVASVALLAAVVIAVPLLVWIAATPVQTAVSSLENGPYPSMQDLLHATGFDLPGRFVADPPGLGAVDWRVDRGYATAALGRTAAMDGRWRDLRLEAWRASGSGGEIDRAFATPFATSPMTMQSGRLVGAVRVDRTRDVSQWWLLVTGVAADGGRDLIATVGGSNTTFTGSAWDWLTAR